jgi:hypothetical protein
VFKNLKDRKVIQVLFEGGQKERVKEGKYDGCIL